MELEYDKILDILKELRENSSITEKLKIIERNKEVKGLKEVFKYAYSDYKYGVTMKNVDFNNANQNNIPKDLFVLLDDLRERRLTGKKALEAVCSGIYYSNFSTILVGIIQHDLNDGVGLKTVSKVWPDLSKTFSVALGDKLSDKTKKKVDFQSGEWYASRKLDGCRCVCIKENGKVNFYARSGKEFYTLDVLKKDVEKLPYDNFVLDGECCIVDQNGDEDFIKIVSEIKRKNHTIENPRYMVFDCLTLDEFRSGTGAIFEERQNRPVMQELAWTEHLQKVLQVKVTSEDYFNRLFERSAELGWEGLMLRKNVAYEGKRTQNMLKCKKFQDAEYKIVDVEIGPIKWTENGRQVEHQCVTNFTINHKGTLVGVGSGLSKEQRVYFAQHPDELKGRVATIKYFQESKSADGKWSLRFPVLKALYEKGRDI